MYRAHEHDWGWRAPKPDKRHLYSPSILPAQPARVRSEDQKLDDWRAVVHPLVLCPPLDRGTRYLLVARTWPGQRKVLGAGCARSPHGSLNLACVRHTAAKLGANEVHVLPA